MTAPTPAKIQTMFDRLARRYDLFNHLTGMGMATLWRRAAVEDLSPGMRVLDLGCGTGDLVLAAAGRVGADGEVVGLDFSPNMIELASRRAARLKKPGPNVRFLLKGAEELPVAGEPLYDEVLSGFVLRNLYYNIETVLRGVHASLKPGGRISFLDITEPPNRLMLMLWRMYMNTAVALYGKLLFGKDYPMFYLTDSARRFLKKDDFVQALRAAGFGQVRTRDFMAGVIVLYQAVK